MERGERFGRAAWAGELHLRFSEGLYAEGRYFEAVQPGQLQLNSGFVNFISPSQQLPSQLSNANFVINGDAELIMTLEMGADGKSRASASSIENLVERDKLLALEGGKEAFQLRENRYGIG